MNTSRTVTRSPGSVIAGNLPRVDQEVTPAQRQFGKAPAVTTVQAQIPAQTEASDFPKNRMPERTSSYAGLNRLSMRPLTDRQRMALDFIAAHIENHGFPPTIREIGAAMSIRSTNGVNDHLRALERKGYIRREDLLSRSIRVVGVNLPMPDEATPPALAPIRTRVLFDREVIARTIAKLEELADWIPRPMVERFEDIIQDLRTEMHQRSA